MIETLEARGVHPYEAAPPLSCVGVFTHRELLQVTLTSERLYKRKGFTFSM